MESLNLRRRLARGIDLHRNPGVAILDDAQLQQVLREKQQLHADFPSVQRAPTVKAVRMQ
jgi:hypothetical protein